MAIHGRDATGTTLAAVHANPILDELGSYPITELQDRARRMRAAGQRVIDFSIGDPREPTPEFIVDALHAAVPAVTQYPTVAGLDELRRAVAAYCERRFGVTVEPATQVLACSGAKEAIFSTPLAFIDRARGDAVIFGSPAYPIYERGALLAGAAAHPVRLDGDFVLRPDMIDGAVWERARILWNCSPHSPSGAVTSQGELKALYQACRDAEVLLCSDECYADVYEDDPPTSALEVAGPDQAGVLIYLSLSKRSGMTGYRSGAIVGDAAAVDTLRRLRSSVGVGSPEFIQAAAVAAWSDDEHAARRRKIFAEKRAILRPAFEDLGMKVVASRAGLYLWVQVEDEMTATRLLLDGGVVVSPGSIFGPGGEGHLRLALVPTVEECAEAVEVVRACLTTAS